MQIQPNPGFRHAAASSPGSPARVDTDRFTPARPADHLDALRDLARMTGNRGLLDKVEAARKLREARASRNIPAFTPEVRRQVRDYLQGSDRVPDGFDAEHSGFLESLRSLRRQGVQFVDFTVRPMDAAEAFERMVTDPNATGTDQVYYKSYGEATVAGQTFSGIKTATIRAEYLRTLDYFLEEARHGALFTDPATGKPFDAAGFIHHYKGDVSQLEARREERRLREREEMQRMLDRASGQADPEAGQIVDLGDEIVIGGVVLSKSSA